MQGWTTYGIVGPTASGKSKVANKLIKTGKCIIINADSQQIFWHLPILSAIPQDLSGHVLYGILDHNDVGNFSVAKWAKLVHEEVKFVHSQGKIAILVGGTGMYFKALQDGIVQMPELNNDIESYVSNLTIEQLKSHVSNQYAAIIHDRRRLQKAAGIFLQTNKHIEEWYCGKRDFKLPIKVYALLPDRIQIWRNIEKRLARLDEMICQVIEFSSKHKCDIEMIGYDEILEFIHEFKINSVDQYLAISGSEFEAKKKELKEIVLYRTRQYAKRQSTYIRNCLDAEIINDADILYEKLIDSLNQHE